MREIRERSQASWQLYLATLTRNTCRIAGTAAAASFDKLAEPTPTQRRAFELIGASIPLRLA